jgi:hypothetical protein
MLVTICGRVTYAGGTFFYIDDGSHMSDDPTYIGVKVDARSLVTVPQYDYYVCVTGISSVDMVGDSTRRLLRAMSWSRF